MMEPTTLDGLLATPGATVFPEGIRVVVSDSWIVSGEDRLSYASVIRLAECCREHHWKQDLASLAAKLDSVVGRCDASFMKPVIAGSRIELCYAVTRVGERSYECTITIGPVGRYGAIPQARIVLTNVFYDPYSRGAIAPPRYVMEVLRSLLTKEARP